ncbi:hypothetical protein LXL04_002561 [Taraxacum kok-saghyz]
MLRSINTRHILSVVKRQFKQNVKETADRPYGNLTTIKILASNSKVSMRYESRKTANEQRNYRLLRSRTGMAVISKSGLQTTNRQNSQSVKDNEDRSHDILTTVKTLDSNSKGSRRYESRKSAYKQRDYRLSRSRTEMAIVSEPELQTTNRRMF